MILNETRAIEQAKDVEDLKVLLKKIEAAVNLLGEAKNQTRGNIIFKDDATGIIQRGTDGMYYQLEVVPSDKSAIWKLLGRTEPKE